jgi:glycylpeptide N-tetradecanoyltransferase
MSLGD